MTPEEMKAQKLYYDDPLVAAYMAHEFGVEYTGGAWSEQSAQSYGHGLFNVNCYTNFIADVSPDSLSVFEPKVGDLIVVDDKVGDVIDGYGRNPEPPACVVRFYMTNPSLQNCSISTNEPKIIQRNGKPFFMPKEVGDD